MNRTTRCALAVFAAAMAWPPPAALHAAKTEAATAPNIVVILADDLGYGDVQCYNRQRGKIPTPNTDRLAAEGMRFTDAHSSSGVCSPSRRPRAASTNTLAPTCPTGRPVASSNTPGTAQKNDVEVAIHKRGSIVPGQKAARAKGRSRP